MFFAFSWVWIPIIAILVGGFTEWLKFKAKQQELGASTHELEQAVAELHAALEAQQKALVRRIENLEAIVTSQAWDVLHDDVLPGPEKERRLAQARIELDPVRQELTDEEKTEALARRLKV